MSITEPLATAITQLVSVIIDTQKAASLPPAPTAHYYARGTAPQSVRGRTWDAAVKDLTPEGKCFRPGREILIRCADLHAWIEAHPVQRAAQPADVANDDPIDFAEFKRTALRPRRRG